MSWARAFARRWGARIQRRASLSTSDRVVVAEVPPTQRPIRSARFKRLSADRCNRRFRNERRGLLALWKKRR
jgi:hypothetical protein